MTGSCPVTTPALGRSTSDPCGWIVCRNVRFACRSCEWRLLCGSRRRHDSHRARAELKVLAVNELTPVLTPRGAVVGREIYWRGRATFRHLRIQARVARRSFSPRPRAGFGQSHHPDVGPVPDQVGEIATLQEGCAHIRDGRRARRMRTPRQQRYFTEILAEATVPTTFSIPSTRISTSPSRMMKVSEHSLSCEKICSPSPKLA